MSKRILLALGLLLASIASTAAQNTTCSNRPAGDSSNACANTRFVATALLPYVLGPGSSSLGQIAWWNNTAGTLLGSAPSYQSGNPANASIYSQIANPTAGYTTVYNGFQFSQGTAITAAGMFGANTVGLQQALVGTLTIAAGDATGYPGYAVIGYCASESGGGNTGCVGSGGFARPGTSGTNASLWGSNVGVGNNYSSASNTGLDANWLSAIELNINIAKKTAGAEPTINQSYGIYIIGSGDSTANQGVGVSVNRLSIVTSSKWNIAFESTPGAAVTGMKLGATAFTGTSLDSQLLTFGAVGGGGGALTATLGEDSGGNLIGRASTGAGVILGDSVSNQIVTNPGGTGAKVAFPALVTAGLVANDALGNLSSTLAPSVTSLAYTTTLTGTTTNASALAVGRQGATDPAILVDASTASSATGIKIKSAAAAGGVALSAISSGTNENLTIDAKGSGTITLGATSTGGFILNRATTIVNNVAYGFNNAAATLGGTMYQDASDKMTFKLPASGLWQLIGNGGSLLVDYNITSAAQFTWTAGFTVTNTQDSTSGSTGAINLTAGGLGVTKKIFGGDTITATNGFVVATAAKTLTLKQGANGAVGTFVCTGGGTITISNTFFAIADAVAISMNTAGGTITTPPAFKTVTGATGFQVLCGATDTSTYNYAIIKNAA